MKKQKILAVLLTGALTAGLAACGSADIGTDASSSVSGSSSTASAVSGSSTVTVKTGASGPAADTDATTEEEKQSIESKLNLANNSDVTWSYDSQSDSWTMSITCAVANPELEDYQGVSVNVPGAYVKGIDTDGDGTEDVTADSYSDAVNGTLVIDNDAKITSENGQVYTASTAPVVINTGAAGYSAQENQLASSTYAADGYINVACGNRGKQSTAENSDGESYYTGDAPLCLVDQKNAIRFVKYNILLGNLPGNTEYFVSTGGSGGGAHATMVAATSNNSDFYDYEIEAGAVGVYRNEDGSYSTAVSVNGTDAEISDGVWGCIAYSAISSLAEADMAMAFEYNLDTEYSFNTDFQKQLATYLSQEYMDYINDQNLSVSEAAVGFDLNEDGDTDDTVSLTIEYDENKYADTNGYGGTYLTLYLDEFEQNLNWYLENLDYADGWTWFDTDGNALTDDEVASMTTEDKAEAFLEGRYAKSESADNAGGPGGSAGGSAPAAGQAPSGGNPPSGGDSTSAGNAPSGGNGTSAGNPPDSQGSSGEDIASSSNAMTGGMPESQVTSSSNTQSAQLPSGDTEKAGTPDQGTTQSADSSVDSSNYSTFDEIV
ncbi:MAG: hypothetical protein LIV24_04365, partial [Eubacterium sp.]|nr:hypothetical protein [Eubacterium sp.]